MKTLLLDHPEQVLPRPVRLGHITTLSAPFNQPRRKPAALSQSSPSLARVGRNRVVSGDASPRLARCRLHVATVVRPDASRCGFAAPGGRQSCALPVLSALRAQRLSQARNCVASVVEVNGFEPMTSCLQSRRSPS